MTTDAKINVQSRLAALINQAEAECQRKKDAAQAICDAAKIQAEQEAEAEINALGDRLPAPSMLPLVQMEPPVVPPLPGVEVVAEPGD